MSRIITELPTEYPTLGTIAQWRDQAENLLVYAEPISRVGLYVVARDHLRLVRRDEVHRIRGQGLVPLVENSPLLSWFYALFSVRGFSTFLGFVELSIGLLIALRLASPIFSAAGGLLSAGLFVTTVSFMISTPGVVVPELGPPAITVAPGQFLLKDVGLFAASFWVFVDSLKIVVRR